jgi:hypothetical protein
MMQNSIEYYENESLKKISHETLDVGNNILCELDNQKNKLLSINSKTQNININLNKNWFTFTKKKKHIISRKEVSSIRENKEEHSH